MKSSPAASSSRPRDPLLFGSFDLPAGWGCRKPMAFCRDRDTDTDDAPVAVEFSPAAAATEGGKDSEPRSLAQAAATAQQAPVAGEEAQQEAPRRKWNLRERTSWRDYRAEDARQARKLGSTDAGGGSRGFSVALTRQEIDADFVSITGRKAPRRPRKRTKSVQLKIETLWPGSSLTEVTRDRYKVNEKGGF
ncbi:uncharacterized protein [Miscanthus floridulus]|uniref:uncharacterized protein n=1 Tax=Miscanthus floridulus TaxID=154761 RepID=UPI00345866C5